MANWIKKILATGSCKASRAALRLMHRGGTAFPGKAAMFWADDILADASEGVTTIIVTGTNGKTTTCRILEHALRAAGKDPLANRSGANLLSGITAEFVCDATLTGRARHKYAVIECDEAALRYVAPLVKPAVIVVTNLFRDQLDRYGEVMHTLEVIREAILEVPQSLLCLNADDSLVASLGLDVPNPVRYFGMDGTPEVSDRPRAEGTPEVSDGPRAEGTPEVSKADRTPEVSDDSGAPAISDARRCIRCGAEYRYKYVTYAHLGGFYCPSCGYHRPMADVAVTSVDHMSEDSSTVHMRVGAPATSGVSATSEVSKTSGVSATSGVSKTSGVAQSSKTSGVEVEIGLPALYNLYNAAGAVCAYMGAGFPTAEILRALGDHVNGFGRQEQFVLDGVNVRMILVKNPAGCNQALDYLGTMGQEFDLILCLNDRTADGHDISWIWDADYEKLANEKNLDRIFAYGDRAEDMCVRLKYAGVDTDRISILSDEKEILRQIREGGKPVVILPNYTSMLAVRAALQKAAGGREFWKG